MKKVYIVGMARTPFSSFQGSLSSLSASRLGARAIEGALERAGIKPEDVDEVFMGNVLAAGMGQAPARQAARYACLPDKVPCTTVNKVCGSGMKSITLGMQSIQVGENELVVVGGMENMSQAPFLLKNVRKGYPMGNRDLLDSMITDGLWDPYSDQHMGNCGDLCAREKGFTREDQDNFATESFHRAQKAQKNGKHAQEIVPVDVPGPKGSINTVDTDEGPGKVKFEKIPQLRPAFGKDGTVTAANASSINDGACCLILASEEKVKKLGLTPLAEIIASASHAQAPEWFTTAPETAMKKVLDRSSWAMDDVDLVEVNEAFAVVALAAQKGLSIPSDKLNIWGGAISLGHPIGASGTRIVLTLVNQLKDLKKKRGVASICIGGGEAMALSIQAVD